MSRLVSIQEAAQISGLSVTSLRRGVHSGRFPATRANSAMGKLMFDPALLEQVLRNEAYANIRNGGGWVSTTCDIYDLIDCIDGKVCAGKNLQTQIELGYLYPSELFIDRPLPPGWLVYKYHTVDNHKIGPKYAGLIHSENFLPLDEDELEFATALAVSNLELYLDNYDIDGFKSVLMLGRYDAGR